MPSKYVGDLLPDLEPRQMLRVLRIRSTFRDLRKHWSNSKIGGEPWRALIKRALEKLTTARTADSFCQLLAHLPPRRSLMGNAEALDAEKIENRSQYGSPTRPTS